MSCRRGTPRNDCGCCKSLAEKVRELYQRCANAIKSINGINPDGANNFDILPGAGIQVNPRANGIEIVATGAAPQDVVKSVNGTTPDADGDVQINTGLLTVNTIAPDADGEFSIAAGSGIQINAGTNGIEIENTSQGAIYTGVSPIQISASNEISFSGWKQHTVNNDWGSYLTGYATKEDILLVFTYTQQRYAILIPRNSNVDYTKTNTILPFNNGDLISINLGRIFNNNTTFTGSKISNNFALSNDDKILTWTNGSTNLTVEKTTTRPEGAYITTYVYVALYTR